MNQAVFNIHNNKINKKIYYNIKLQIIGILLFLIILGIMIWYGLVIFNWMKNDNHQPFLQLIITGERYYTTNDDIRDLILKLNKPLTFMKQDIYAIQKQIQKLPWIKHISIRKKWPNELKIHLVEYTPVVYWNDIYKIDINGISFKEPKAWVNKKTLPFLYGPKGSEKEVLEGYRIMNNMLHSKNYILKTVLMRTRHSWQLTLDNNAKLELGRNNYINRLQRFIDLYPILQQKEKIEKKRISYIDLRYESGASVIWVPVLIHSFIPDTQQKK
ncbi:Cell division protein FtsQ [Serratia symbiotica]|nr:Cell division protein FtsQ [Serratia symbiotica]